MSTVPRYERNMMSSSLTSQSPIPLIALSVLVLIIAWPVAIAGPVSQNPVLQSVPAPGGVTLDGRLDEWDTSGEILVCDDMEKPRHAVRVASMYDATGVYLAFRFFDLTPMVNHVNPVSSPARGWCGDAVQLRWWSDPEKPLGPPDGGRILHLDCYWYTDGKRPTAHAVFGSFKPGYTVEKTVPEAIGVGVAAAFLPRPDGRGYVQEMRIDWSMLSRGGRAYRAGEALRLGMETFWGDAQSRQKPAFRVADIYHPDHPQRDYFWMNNEAWGTVTFLEHGRLTPTATATEIPRIEKLLAGVTVVADPEPLPAPPPPDPDAGKFPYRDTPLAKQLLPGAPHAGAQVNAWVTEGTAAGNTGDWYDNRDRGHSLLDLHAFSQFTLQDYTDDARRNGADWGATTAVQPHVTIGNSSTSGPPDESGSNPRSLYLGNLAALYAQYRGNNLHVYPEHRDYDPGHNGRPGFGDLLPVNTPYLLISQGSSGSDQAFLEAVALTLAAFQPVVKRELITRGLLMPTVQAILRATYATDVFTGAAHPPVFDGAKLDPQRMVALAHAMRVASIPPLVQLKLVRETAPVTGILSEKIADTPAVIARVHRRLDRELHLLVSAQDSVDVHKRPLTFRWVVLQGDPQRIRIHTRAHGTVADITIAWHGRYPIAPGSAMESNRVDIGVFATNSGLYSAPGFITVYNPDNELRTYDTRGRLIDAYAAAGDTTIGFDTQALLPAGDVPTYDITDWPAAGACALGEDATLPGQLLRAQFSPADRALLLRAFTEFHTRWTTFPAAKTRIVKDARLSYLDQMKALDALVASTSQPLWQPDLARRTSAKAILERALNAVKDDPQLYLQHRDTIDALVAEAPEAVRTAVTQALTRLRERGILTTDTDGWPAWQSVRTGRAPVWQRLTAYEQYEIAAFNLLLLTKVLYPQFLNCQPRVNVVDRRLAQPQETRTLKRP
jgi:hypothetical protein